MFIVLYDVFVWGVILYFEKRSNYCSSYFCNFCGNHYLGFEKEICLGMEAFNSSSSFAILGHSFLSLLGTLQVHFRKCLLPFQNWSGFIFQMNGLKLIFASQCHIGKLYFTRCFFLMRLCCVDYELDKKKNYHSEWLFYL